MDLLTRLQEDMKTALRGGEKQRLSVIRMLISDIKNIGLSGTATTAEQAVEQYAKRLRKSREEYEKLKQPEQVQQLDQEILIVEQYMPKKASAEDTERLVDEFLAKQSFNEKQFGQAMGAFMKQHGSQVDPGKANELLRRKLSGK